MKGLMIAAVSLMSLSAFAQNLNIEQRIEKRLERLNRLIINERAHMYGSEAQKKAVLGNINEAILNLSSDGNEPGPTPLPQPMPSVTPAACSWYDGGSRGIAQRGYHAVRIINGVHFSLGFYENGGIRSLENCQRDLIFNLEEIEYRQPLRQGAATTCACTWFDGGSKGIAARGYHLNYRVQLATGTEAILSSNFYGNGGTSSLQNCNRDLVLNNFICPIK